VKVIVCDCNYDFEQVFSIESTEKSVTSMLYSFFDKWSMIVSIFNRELLAYTHYLKFDTMIHHPIIRPQFLSTLLKLVRRIGMRLILAIVNLIERGKIEDVVFFKTRKTNGWWNTSSTWRSHI